MIADRTSTTRAGLMACLLLLGCSGDKSAEDPAAPDSTGDTPTDTSDADTSDVPDDTPDDTDDTTDDTDDTDDSGPDDTGPEPFTPPASVTLNLIVGVHAGEGRCTLENVYETGNEDYVACRDALMSIAAAFDASGVRAEWQLHPGFLALLHQDGVDLATELLARRQGIAGHLHTQCLFAEDDAELCAGASGEWGRTSGDTEPTVEVFDLRTRSLGAAFDATPWTPSSFNFWGGEHHLSLDATKGTREGTDLLVANGWGLPTIAANVPYDFRRADDEACFDGLRDEDGDVWKALVQPVTFEGTAGGEVVVYSTATPKWGANTYTDAQAEVGLLDTFQCLTERVTHYEATGWRGEVFAWTGLTHLHNLMEDADRDGAYDGLAHVAGFAILAERMAEEWSSDALTVTVDFPSIAEVEALRVAAEADGASHDY